MAKTQNHECKVTKGHKRLERNGEEGPFMVEKLCTNLLPLTDNREMENGPMGAVLISHCGRNPCLLIEWHSHYQSQGGSTIGPVGKQGGPNDILTHRSVVGHSLQLLDNIYIQQLKGQQILKKKRGGGHVGLLATHARAVFCVKGHWAPHRPRCNSCSNSCLISVKWEQEELMGTKHSNSHWEEREQMQWGWRWTS